MIIEMYKLKSKLNLNILIKRKWLELERCLFLNFSQNSDRSDLNELVAALKQLPKGRGELIFGTSLHAPTQLVLKLSLDSKRSVSSDFTLGKRKKFAGVISME
jgi:hypothetical protein